MRAVSRFRPILITTVTTMAGLTPLMLTESVQAKSMVPMAISLGFRRAGLFRGGTCSSCPSLWLVLNDISHRAKRATDQVSGPA